MEFLIAKPLSKADIRSNLKENQSITEAVRQKALALVELYREGTNPQRFHDASRAVVRLPYSTPQMYRSALMQAQTACRLAPHNRSYVATLGITQYRLGKFQKEQHAHALATLTKCDPSDPATLAFLAMTQHQLGQKEEARATIARLREVMHKPEWAKNEEAQAFLREAKVLIESKPTSLKK